MTALPSKDYSRHCKAK